MERRQLAAVSGAGEICTSDGSDATKGTLGAEFLPQPVPLERILEMASPM